MIKLGITGGIAAGKTTASLFIKNQGKAFARMSSQSIAHLLMVIFILFGNISFYYSKRKNS